MAISHTPIPKLDISALPENLRNNWIVLNCIRANAQRAYAMTVAGTSNNSKKWCAKFDSACRDWVAANPMEPHWAAGKWPEGAELNPGNSGIELALAAIAKAVPTPPATLSGNAIIEPAQNGQWQAVQS